MPYQIACEEEKVHTGQKAEEFRQVSQILLKVEGLDKFLRDYDLYDQRKYFIENELFMDVLVTFTKEDHEKIDLKMGPKKLLSRGLSDYRRKIKYETAQFDQKLLALQSHHRVVDEQYIEEIRQFLFKMSPSIEDVVFIEFDQLEFIEELGRGSSGSVWKGMLRTTTTSNPSEERTIEVAIKTLINGDQNNNFLDEFKKEFKVLHSIQHKNVVKLFGVCLKPSFNLIMEYCGCGSLYHVLSSNKGDFNIGWEFFFNICKQTVEGLKALHTHQPEILHRDLKTLNLLITLDMTVKVADFGLSLDASAKSVDLKEQRGTSAYMPPELLHGTKYSTQSDIYSLGIIFWEILFRVLLGKYQKPFGEFENLRGPQGEILIILSVADANVPLRPTIPENTPEILKHLITECYDGNPEKRPICEEVKKILLKAEEEYKSNKEEWDKKVWKKSE